MLCLQNILHGCIVNEASTLCREGVTSCGKITGLIFTLYRDALNYDDTCQ